MKNLNWLILAISLLYFGASVWELRKKHYALAVIYLAYAVANTALLFLGKDK